MENSTNIIFFRFADMQAQGAHKKSLEDEGDCKENSIQVGVKRLCSYEQGLQKPFFNQSLNKEDQDGLLWNTKNENQRRKPLAEVPFALVVVPVPMIQ
jgi:hypothetical protein